MIEGPGPAWPPPPDPIPDAPDWINGRAFPAVWREMLAFTVGGMSLPAKQFPRVKPGLPWNHRPPPDTEEDVEQAISAKLHLGLRMLPLLAEAQVVLVEPRLAEMTPDWTRPEEAALYASEAKLPVNPVFLDMESDGGLPAAWEAETWPRPFHLRGALCWVREEMLSVIPFGSVGGRHPWGGNDYQAWGRWVYLQGHSEGWPDPGPGDFIARPTGELLPWVDAETESICAHQGIVAHNLARRVLSVLMAVEAVGGGLVEAPLRRSLLRRARRESKHIALIPGRFPELVERRPGAEENPAPTDGPLEACVLPETHARLEQAHALWHETLAAYGEPDEFVIRLNALVQALRSVTFVLQKEADAEAWFEDWYAARQTEMRADHRMRWLVDARNTIVHRGDLDTNSVAHIRVVGSWFKGAVAERRVDPTADAGEIARRVMVAGLPERARREGTLEVERRWTVPTLAGDELLDALAHCHGVLVRIVASAHQQKDGLFDHCDVAPPACGARPGDRHPSGRLPCMLASREARTSRRDLATGAPYQLGLETVQREGFDPEQARERYGLVDWEPATAGSTLREQAATLHELGKRMLLTDGNHISIAWLYRAGAPAAPPTVVYPEDQRDKHMMMQHLADQADQLGADAVVFNTETWMASLLDPEDPRAELPAEEREDRTEGFVTYLIQRDQPPTAWLTPFTHEAEAIVLGTTQEEESAPLSLYRALVERWDSWPSIDNP